MHCVKGCKDSIDMDPTDVHLHLNFTLEHLPQSVLWMWMCDNKLSKSWHSHVIVWIVIVNIVQY